MPWKKGRELLVVPGGIYDQRYEGSLHLLKQGASMVTSVEDAFNILELPSSLDSRVQSTVAKESSSVVELLLKDSRMHVDELKRLLGSEAKSPEAEFLRLEMAGVI